MEFLHRTTTLGKFVLLDQTRYDVSEKLSILGCTLFSKVSEEQRDTVGRFVTDFHAIKDWSVEQHNAAHESDLAWLNAQVSKIEEEEPEKEMVIFTHHCPSKMVVVNDEKHSEDAAGVGSAFVTDLSRERCWRGERVKMWAWGHTHFNFDVRDEGSGRRLVGNQKGYGREELLGFDVEKVVGIGEEFCMKKRERVRRQEGSENIDHIPQQTLRRRREWHAKCIVL